ncbi:flagellar hook-length control protein FliK [Paenibacillus solisilvae]|uniref:Flagellar hook-length control protein FliK n=1 Tax=Paenibacillus solisilvae TaxID=2486751 RepID=A0ABW0VW88_9BACL
MMNMNIGQLVRGLLGEVQAGDSKALELKVGQVVRGVIMQMMDNNEAMVQINGTLVQAKLETALQPGQSTLLQVQPQSASGTLVLKMVDQHAASFTEESVKEWVKTLALPDQKWAAELVRDLRRDGAVLTREIAKQFQQAAAAMPKGGDTQQWMQAAALAFKRGLPMTGATVGALQQSLSGAPAHALLEALERGLAAWSGAAVSAEAAGGAKPQTSAAQAAAAKLQALLAQGAALAAKPSGAMAELGGAKPPALGLQAAPGEAEIPLLNGRAPVSENTVVVSTSSVRQTGQQSINPVSVLASITSNQQQAEQAAEPSQTSTTNAYTLESSSSSSGWVGKLMKWLGIDHEHLLALSTVADGIQNSSRSSEQTEDGLQTGQQANLNTKASATEQAATVPHNDRNSSFVPMERAVQLLQAGMTLPTLAQDDSVKAAADTFKSALLTLAAGDDVPQSLRDTAQQLVQHVTGQQLLLTPERTGSPFTHVTMFIPMQGPDGSQTASVHIQTGRGRKGELDADNCRLLFDLKMKTLGDTIVDVQVVDKIVSLNLWNDHPVITDLLESSRGEMAQALQGAGFKLLTLRSKPMPNRTVHSDSDADAKGSVPAASAPEWSSKPYRGVDIRA